jgi:hypothetical protein
MCGPLLKSNVRVHRSTKLPAVVLAAVACLSACNRADSPEAAANDIAEAKQSAAQEVSDARRDAAKQIDKADKAAQEKSNDLSDANIKAQYDVAAAKADGIRKIALQQCMTKDGAAQRSCKQQADAEYDASTAHAKAATAEAQAR